MYKLRPDREAYMYIEEKDIAEALRLAHANHWPNGIPIVRAQVRLAINSLLTHDRFLFKKNAHEITKVLRMKKNSGIRKILKNTSVEAFAFGIYSALN